MAPTIESDRDLRSTSARREAAQKLVAQVDSRDQLGGTTGLRAVDREGARDRVGGTEEAMPMQEYSSSRAHRDEVITF